MRNPLKATPFQGDCRKDNGLKSGEVLRTLPDLNRAVGARGQPAHTPTSNPSRRERAGRQVLHRGRPSVHRLNLMRLLHQAQSVASRCRHRDPGRASKKRGSREKTGELGSNDQACLLTTDGPQRPLSFPPSPRLSAPLSRKRTPQSPPMSLKYALPGRPIPAQSWLKDLKPLQRPRVPKVGQKSP